MATISAEVVEARLKEYGRLWTIDDLIRVRAQDEVQAPILGYPRYDNKPTDYEYFTGKDLDRMVDETCHLLVRAGLKMNFFETVALFVQSDLSFVATFFALFRLGCKALIMSIRLGEPACLNLLTTTECDTILYGTTARITAAIADLKKAVPRLRFMPTGRTSPEPFIRPIADKEAEHVQTSLIMHSSGSTGLPKPLFLSHRSIITTLPTGTGLRAFNALPWYHVHGLFTSLMAMWMRQPAHLFNAHLPLTAENLILALKEARPEICHCVPYTLKLMAESEDGIEVLRRCKYVTSAGARTPDEVGNRVVNAGVKFGDRGGPRGGLLYREPGDDTWDYVRPYPSLRPYMIFKLRSGGGGDTDVYEAVYLKTHPALKMSNSDSPPGSFHSRDLWTPHPTLPDAWKYVARDDDTVTLLSGEKILPLGIEGAIRESPLVRDALVVGNDRLAPGVLVFRAAATAHVPALSDAEFVDAIWPHVQAGNQLADEFARIPRDMVVPIPADVDYPATDKGNLIRGAAYAQFRDYIDAMYAEKKKKPPHRHLQANGRQLITPAKKLDIKELERIILDLLHDQVEIRMPDIYTDFFAAGVDSLRAAQLRRILLQNLDLGSSHDSLPTNAIYDAGNVENLAQKLYAMSLSGNGLASNGQTIPGPATAHGDSGSDLELMQTLIDEYGTFERRKPGDLPNPEKETVILTGATGALGAHILHLLLQDPQVDKIYCLVRSSSTNSAKDAADRVQTSPAHAAPLDRDRQKLAALTTDDLGAPNLGLSSPAIFATLQATTTMVVHAAWPVNFNLGLASFRSQLAGLRRLLGLAADRRGRVLHAGRVGGARGPLADLARAAPTGYAWSKLVGERICELAAAASMSKGKAAISTSNGEGDGDDDGAGSSQQHVAVLRVGQVAADTEHGIWNEKEAIPLLVRSGAQIGALPRFGKRPGRCQWMPADTAAQAVLDLAARMTSALKPPNGVTKGPTGNEAGIEISVGDDSGSNGSTEPNVSSAALFYNLVAPHHFSWNDEFLPAVRASGVLRFEEVDLPEWLARLRTRAVELGDEAEERLPAIKLADYYERSYMEKDGEEDSGRDSSAGLTWDVGRACAHSEALRTCPQVVKAGLVPKMVRNWLEVDGVLPE
ncbi:NRPS-like enzyme [Apiospora aurea]|uniref:NRPS-like enzyme n=1 Tax=Apiospora aurea TaxID=335848 RepID=A0ABR1QUX5_9PEZI